MVKKKEAESGLTTKEKEETPVPQQYKTDLSLSFNIDATILRNTLALIKKHSYKNNAMPALSYTLCTIDADTLSFYFTNLEMEVRQLVGISQVKGELKSFLVDIEDLNNIAKVMTVELVSIEVFGTNIKIMEGFNEYNIPLGPNPAEYPIAQKDKKLASVKVDYNKLLAILSNAELFIGHNESRAYFNGVYLEVGKDNFLKITGTNSNVLYHNELEVQDVTEECNAIIPASFISVLKSIGKKDMTMNVNFSKKRVWFSLDNIEVRCLLIDATYPNYVNIIPRTNPCSVKFDRAEMSGAIKKIVAVAKAATKMAILKFEAEKTILISRSTEFSQDIRVIVASTITGEMPKEEIPQIDGDPKVMEGNMIGLNYNFIKEMLDVFDTKEVYLHGSSHKWATIWNASEGLNNYFILIMPVMVQ